MSMRTLVTASLMMIATIGFAADEYDVKRIVKYIADAQNVTPAEAMKLFTLKITPAGTLELGRWDAAMSRPTLADLAAVGDLAVVEQAFDERLADKIVRDGGKWRKKTTQELNADAQAAKSVRQKQLENRFYELTETLLVALSDPRAGQIPPTKLDDDELPTLLEALEDLGGQNIKLADRLSKKLLMTENALIRINPNWWDTAEVHP